MIDRRLLALFALAISLAAPAAGAGNRERAARAMQTANAHLDKKEYAEAIEGFNVARELAPTSSGPYLGLGLAYAATDRCPDAIGALEEYLRRQTKRPKPEALVQLEECRAKATALPKPPPLPPPPSGPRVKVVSDPSGAEVRFDSETGAAAGLTPFEGELSKGKHVVFLSRPGYKPHRAEVTADAAALATVAAALEPLPPPPEAHPVRSPLESNSPLESKQPPLKPVAPPQMVASLEITASDPLATIFVNSERTGEGHVKLRVPPGLYRLAVDREEFRGAAESVTLLPGDARSYRAELKPLRTHGWLALGGAFTLLALGGAASSIAGHVLAGNAMPGSDDFNNYNSLERYGAVAAGACALVAVIGYVLEGVMNRKKVPDGPPYRMIEK